MFAKISRKDHVSILKSHQTAPITCSFPRFARYKQYNGAAWIRAATSSSILKQEHVQLESQKDEVQNVANENDHGISLLEFRHARLSRDSRRRLEENSTSLSLSTQVLGQSARIRVLREKPKQSKFKPIPSSSNKLEALREIVSEKILQEINAEAGTVDAATVNSNIEEFRERLKSTHDPEKPPTTRQYSDVAKLLLEGFTVPQLEGYLAASRSTLTDKKFDLTQSIVSNQYVRSPWIEGVTSVFPKQASERVIQAAKGWDLYDINHPPATNWKDNEEPLQNGHKKKQKEKSNNNEQSLKNRLVGNILRRSWKIRTQEEEFVEGEVDIRMNSDSLKLLLSHRRDYFQSLAQLYHAKIDISKSHNIVRLTGDFGTCHDLIKAIQNTVDNIRHAEIDLTDLEYANLTYHFLTANQLLEKIGKLTNTLITPGRAKGVKGLPSKLRVSYVASDTRDLEDAQRLLLQLTKLDTKGDSRSFYLRTSDKTVSSISADLSVTLPWTEQSERWTRWSTSLENKVKADELSQTRFSEKTFLNLSNFEHSTVTSMTKFFIDQRPQPSLETSQANTYWRSQETHSVMASIGQVLYPEAQTKSHAAKESESIHKRNDSRRIFVSSPFNLLTALKEVKSQNPIRTHELRIRLCPTAKSNKLIKDSLPNINLFIDLDGDQKRTRLKRINLMIHDCTVDLLVPEKAVDIRFISSSFLESLENNVDPRILSFVENSNLDVWGTDRLRTPPKVELSIPGHAIKQPPGPNERSMESLKAEYAFLSLEQRSSLHLDYQGFPLVYTTVEAGKSGGRRDELCLHPRPDENSAVPAQDSMPPFPDSAGVRSLYCAVRDLSSKIKAPSKLAKFEGSDLQKFKTKLEIFSLPDRIWDLAREICQVDARYLKKADSSR